MRQDETFIYPLFGGFTSQSTAEGHSENLINLLDVVHSNEVQVPPLHSKIVGIVYYKGVIHSTLKCPSPHCTLLV